MYVVGILKRAIRREGLVRVWGGRRSICLSLERRGDWEGVWEEYIMTPFQLACCISEHKQTKWRSGMQERRLAELLICEEGRLPKCPCFRYFG